MECYDACGSDVWWTQSSQSQQIKQWGPIRGQYPGHVTTLDQSEGPCQRDDVITFIIKTDSADCLNCSNLHHVWKQESRNQNWSLGQNFPLQASQCWCDSQSEASVQVTWSLSANERPVCLHIYEGRRVTHMRGRTDQRPVSRSRDHSQLMRGQYLYIWGRRVTHMWGRTRAHHSYWSLPAILASLWLISI